MCTLDLGPPICFTTSGLSRRHGTNYPHVLISFSSFKIFAGYSPCSFTAHYPTFALYRCPLRHETLAKLLYRLPPHWHLPTHSWSASSTCLSISPPVLGSSKLTAITSEPSKMCYLRGDVGHSHIWCSSLTCIRIGLSGHCCTQPSLLHHGTGFHLGLVFKVQDREAMPAGWITWDGCSDIRFNERKCVCALKVEEVEDQHLNTQQQSERDLQTYDGLELSWL